MNVFIVSVLAFGGQEVLIVVAPQTECANSVILYIIESQRCHCKRYILLQHIPIEYL